MAAIAPSTICSRTAKGLAEVKNKSGKLSRENGIVLQCIDGKKRLNELQAALGMTMAHLLEALDTLIAQGYVNEVAPVAQQAPKRVTAAADDDLDFSSPEAIAEFNRQADKHVRKQPDSAPKQRPTSEAKQRAVAEAKQRAEAEAKKQAEAEAKKRAEAEAKKRAEAERKAREEAERKVREEAERKAREEAERRAREEAERKAREEAERKAREEAERKAREEAERKAREEAERKAREEAERRAREEAERKAREEAERRAREEAERKAREEAERRAREEAERKAREEAERRAREEAERKAREEAERRAREEAERKAREEAERRAREEAERRAWEEAERKAREEAERLIREETERNAREEAERKGREEAERLIREEAERRRREEAEQRAREEAAQHERAAHEEAQRNARMDAERREREEAERLAAQAVQDALSPTAAHEPQITSKALEDDAYGAKGDEDHAPAAPDWSAADLVQKLKAKVKAERRSRMETERRPFLPEAGEIASDAALQTGMPGVSPDHSEAVHNAPQDYSRGESEPNTLAHHDQFSPLERALQEHVSDSDERASPEPAAASADYARRHEQEASYTAAESQPYAPAIDRTEPLQPRLNADRAAHDVLAETASARHDYSRVMSGYTAESRDSEESRRAAALRRKKRVKVLVATGAGIALVASFIGAVILQFVPLTGYIPQVQQALSDGLKQPARISTLHYALLPTPHLVLQGVTIGSGIRIDRLEAPALITATSKLPSFFDTVSVRGVTITAEALGSIPSWPTSRSMRVRQLELEDVKVEAPDSELISMTGNAVFQPDGQLQQAKLSNDKIQIVLTPATQGLQLIVTGREARIPFGPAAVFSEFTLAGTADQKRFTSSELNGRLAGGSFNGSVRVTWNGPIVVNGDFNVQKLRLQELAPFVPAEFVVNGALTASGRYTLQSDTSDALAQKPQIEANFTISRGEFTNLDLLRATQSSGSSWFGGGRTAFEEIRGTVKTADGQSTYRAQVASGPLSANGSFTINPAGQLNGRANTELNRNGEVTRTALKVGGTSKEPLLGH